MGDVVVAAAECREYGTVAATNITVGKNSGTSLNGGFEGSS